MIYRPDDSISTVDEVDIKPCIDQYQKAITFIKINQNLILFNRKIVKYCVRNE